MIQASQVIDFIRSELKKELYCLSDERIEAIISGEVTSDLFFRSDKTLQVCSLDSIRKMMQFFNLTESVASKFDLVLEKNTVFSTVIEPIFSQTNLHSGQITRLKENFEILEKWLKDQSDLITDYTDENLKSDLKAAVDFTFLYNEDTLYQVLNSFKDTTAERKELQAKMVEILDLNKEETSDKVVSLISQKIMERALSANSTMNLSYHWLLQLTNQELKIQNFSDLKSCPLFAPVFNA